MTGKQVKLFLVDGTPGGLMTAEITNWTGSIVSARRSALAELLGREEAERTGVYLLLGEDEDAVGDTRCYIGEADTVATRLRSHAKEKPFWNQAVVVTSKDTNLTKSHVRYLESRLIELATQAGRVTLENGTAPPRPRLPEADLSDMEYFLGQLQIVLPVLGVNAIRVRPQPGSPEAGNSTVSPVFQLKSARLGVNASAQQIDGEFVMLSGSLVVPHWHGVGNAISTQRAYASYRAQHEELLAEGSIVVENGTGRTTRDIVFSSPSTAGAIALGRSCNGRVEWVSAEGAFGAWESRGVEDA
ncbi:MULTISPECIES: GIY-YIG nuclease family protein [unclassified Leucobacter]|uniref:GIY-YIG nuclease family protein n=1 Tax=unclassified Leucobacter TaxID=2621730 RepID=UPI00165D92B3|nr:MULTISPECIES: GIY-YIG nuclease family protein [unclassified Leucobacter]MBC9928664.1 GIY-YIG nuclease family protein [Leucobacter sp. cx-169]